MTIDINLQSKFDQVINASKKIRKNCNIQKIPHKVSDEIELSVIEALNNIIEHAYDSDPDNRINITLTFLSNQIEIKISDEGKPRDNFETPNANFDPEDIEMLPERGLGLFIIYQLMDDVNYLTLENQNTLTLLKKYNK